MDLSTLTKKQRKTYNKIVGYKAPSEEPGIEMGELSSNVIDLLKLPWYFEKTYEKIILLLVSSLGVWKIVELIKWIF